jgi:serine/threonine protein kinase
MRSGTDSWKPNLAPLPTFFFDFFWALRCFLVPCHVASDPTKFTPSSFVLHLVLPRLYEQIKQENILVVPTAEGGCLKLADFGSSSPVRPPRADEYGSEIGVSLNPPMGTVCFSPPERFAFDDHLTQTSAAEVDVARAAASVGFGLPADRWGLGCTLWELATGDCLPLGTGPEVIGQIAYNWIRADPSRAKATATLLTESVPGGIRVASPDNDIAGDGCGGSGSDDNGGSGSISQSERPWNSTLEQLNATFCAGLEARKSTPSLRDGTDPSSSEESEAIPILSNVLQQLFSVCPGDRPTPATILDLLPDTAPTALGYLV